MKYAADSSGNVISFDGKFKHHGVSGVPKGSILCPPLSEPSASAAGCFYMSASREPMQVVWSDGSSRRVFGVARVFGRYAGEEIPEVVKASMVAVCGPVCSMPDKLSELVAELPAGNVYACELVDGLPAMGMLVCSMLESKGYRVDFRQPVMLSDKDECQVYEDGLEGDAEGRMADLVNKGMTVLNKMYESPCVGAFDGRLLSFKEYGDSVYLLRRNDVLDWFPTESLLVRDYASMTVPVELTNTDSFKNSTGCTSEKVKVMVSSTFKNLRSISDFMRFLKVMSGKGWVVSSDPGKVLMDTEVPVFMNNGARKMGADEYRETYHAG